MDEFPFSPTLVKFMLGHWCNCSVQGEELPRDSWVRTSSAGIVRAFVGRDPIDETEMVMVLELRNQCKVAKPISSINEGKRFADQLFNLFHGDGFSGCEIPSNEQVAEAECPRCNMKKIKLLMAAGN